MDADGSGPRNLTQNPAKDVRPAWSPDGRRIAFVSRRDGNSEVYVMNADGSGKRNLTRDRASDDFPTWSPDGRRIAFLRGRLHSNATWTAALSAVVRLRTTLCHERRRQRAAQADAQPDVSGGQLVWSPDGRTIYFGRYLVSADGSGARRLPYIPLTAVWSPDGRQIAFVRTRSGRGLVRAAVPSQSDIYVMNADGSGTRKLTHNAALLRRTCLVPGRAKDRFPEHTKRGQQGDLRHERRRERKAEPHAEPGAGRPSFLVAGRAEDRVRQQPRRASRSSRHERRRERSAESDAGDMREAVRVASSARPPRARAPRSAGSSRQAHKFRCCRGAST